MEARKTVLACFVRPECAPEAVIRFDAAFARGRDNMDSYQARETSLPCGFGESIEELAKGCEENFASIDQPYDQYFFIVLDEQTSRDGTAIVAHNEPGVGVHTIRCSPSSIETLVGCLSIGHTYIPDIYSNDCYEGQEAEFVHDVSFDYSAQQSNVRVPIEKFRRSQGPKDGFTKLWLPAEETASFGLPEVAVEFDWFGEPVTDILLLYGADENEETKHLVGAVSE